jgi:Tol biopolymer transport system component
MWRSNPGSGIGSCLLFLLAACSSDSASGPDQRDTLPLPDAYTAWAVAVVGEQAPGTHPELNTVALEGCPYISPDGKTLFMASNRPGGEGGIDIWYSTRTAANGPWGQPVNAGAPVNSAQNDFCPTLGPDGHTFFFVSNRPGGCGGDDIYVTRRRDDGTFEAPTRLDCQVNSSGNEAGPFLLVGSDQVLYFSSTRAGGFTPEAPEATTGDADIYSSAMQGALFAPAVLVPGVNSAGNDLQPNLRRDGLEIYFASNRSGTPGTLGTLGGVDLFTATRTSAAQPWTTPLNLGASVNSAAGDETRPSLSWDATTLYFGSNRPGVEGASDIFLTTRQWRASAGR